MIYKTVSLHKKLVGTDQSKIKSRGVCEAIFSGQQELAQGLCVQVSLSEIGTVPMLWIGQQHPISWLINCGLSAFLATDVLKLAESGQVVCVVTVHIHRAAVYDHLMVYTKLCQTIM
jgi:hypothetical protein